MTPEEEFEKWLNTNGLTEAWHDEHNACDFAKAAYLAGRNAGIEECSPNAEWLTKAHILCTDNGIPQGNISDRIDLLRIKVEETKDALDRACEIAVENLAEIDRLRAEVEQLKEDRDYFKAEYESELSERLALQAKLSRYESGIVVEGITAFLGDRDAILFSALADGFKYNQRVKVIVLEEE